MQLHYYHTTNYYSENTPSFSIMKNTTSTTFSNIIVPLKAQSTTSQNNNNEEAEAEEENVDFEAFVNRLLYTHDYDDFLYNYDHHHDHDHSSSPNLDNHDDLVLDQPLPLLCDENFEDPYLSSSFKDNNNQQQVFDYWDDHALPLSVVKVDHDHDNANQCVTVAQFGDQRQGQFGGCGDESTTVNNNDNECATADIHYSNNSHKDSPCYYSPAAVGGDSTTTAANNPCSSSSCQLLRQIIHTNGRESRRLEIHGMIGFIFHGVLLDRCNNNKVMASGILPHYQMIDFSRWSFEMIKEFIRNYMEKRKRKGYALLADPLSPFYDTLFLPPGPGPGRDPNNNNIQPPTTSTSTSGVGVAEGEEQKVKHQHRQLHRDLTIVEPLRIPHTTPPQDPNNNKHRSDLAIQRERTRTMTIKDFAKYFDIPVKDAAKKLGLCDTVVKNKVRSFGVTRWPYRKVESMKRRISTLGKDISVENAWPNTRVVHEVQRLQQQIDDILDGNIEVIQNVVL